MENQQVPSLFSFGTASDDALNLTNYVDQMFNEQAVDEIPVSLATIDTKDELIDGKMNVNFSNIDKYGRSELLAMIFPNDSAIEIDVTEVFQTDLLMYQAPSEGWVLLEDLNPQANQSFVKLVNSVNGMESRTVAIVGDAKIQAVIPVSRYQFVAPSFLGSDQAVTIDENLNVTVNVPDTIKMYLIPAGDAREPGKLISETRDYQDLMSGLSFPDSSKLESATLPESGSSMYFSTDCYLSIAVKLEDSDYFSMYTTYMGTDLVYSARQPKYRYATLQVPAGAEVFFEYSLTHEPKYFNCIQPRGRAQA